MPYVIALLVALVIIALIIQVLVSLLTWITESLSHLWQACTDHAASLVGWSATAIAALAAVVAVRLVLQLVRERNTHRRRTALPVLWTRLDLTFWAMALAAVCGLFAWPLLVDLRQSPASPVGTPGAAWLAPLLVLLLPTLCMVLRPYWSGAPKGGRATPQRTRYAAISAQPPRAPWLGLAAGPVPADGRAVADTGKSGAPLPTAQWPREAKDTPEPREKDASGPSVRHLVVGVPLAVLATVLCLMAPADGRLQWVASQRSETIGGLAAGDGRLFTVRSSGLQAVDPRTGQEQWSARQEGADGPPAVGTTAVYTGGAVLSARDPASGAIRWTYLHKGVRLSAPGLDDVSHAVYVFGDDRVLRRFDARTGRERWHVKIGGRAPEALPSPMLAGDRVYLPLDDRVLALRASTGRRVWSVGLSSEATTHLGFAALRTGLVVGSRNTVRLYTARDGRARWRTKLTAVPDAFRTLRAVPDAGSGAEGVYATTDEALYRLDSATGHLRWSTTADPASQAPVVAEHTVFLTESDRTLHAYDAATGRPQGEMSMSSQDEPVLVPGDDVLFAASAGCVEAISTDLSRRGITLRQAG
ncbi:PQQ-binding-like beta-propeller repeat protein [Streptomyces sp. NPDC001835]|uniref:PQQ-binding-like beta-propeller repeat protein n=1 Tax=Streptomyces sp. NPDC001835 TaxID=3154528 RepID=UPI00331DBBBC